jgi:hypothetical protein
VNDRNMAVKTMTTVEFSRITTKILDHAGSKS